jgi:hypothetical protein
MSESMTVVEIEDVLSSIRRLVSEDLRPTHKLVSAALTKGASALILTPALRVVAEDDTEQEPSLEVDGDPAISATVETLYPAAHPASEHAAIVPVFGSVRHVDASEAVFRDSQDPQDQRPEGDFLANAMSRISVLSISAGSRRHRSRGCRRWRCGRTAGMGSGRRRTGPAHRDLAGRALAGHRH